MMKRTVLATVALGALLTAAVPVFAQGGPGGPGGPGGDGHGPRMERMCEDRDGRIAGALGFAERRLKSTDAERRRARPRRPAPGGDRLPRREEERSRREGKAVKPPGDEAPPRHSAGACP